MDGMAGDCASTGYAGWNSGMAVSPVTSHGPMVRVTLTGPQ
jgi:hypothetical protein